MYVKKFMIFLLIGTLCCVFGSCSKKAVKKDLQPFEVIIDNSSETGFRTEGTWESDYGEGGENHGDDSLWAYSNETGEEKAYWKPNLPKDGIYGVYIWYCGDPNDDHATKAPFYVKAEDKTHEIFIDLKENYGKWNLLGEFSMKEGENSHVMTQTSDSGNAIADAVKFIYLREE